MLLNDDDLTYCKLRLDAHSLHTLQHGGLAALEDSLARTLCWSAAWEMVRDGKLATRQYFDLVESGVRCRAGDRRGAVGRQEPVAGPGDLRRAGLGGRRPGRFGELALANARAAEPGSDHQLAWVHALLDAGEQLDFVAGLLAGTEQLDGLVLDTDLRWLMLRALVGGGRAGEAEIAAAAAADPSASGARHAATARARIPTAEAKAAAWQLMVHGPELSTAMRRAVMAGFRDPWRPDLLAPYLSPTSPRRRPVGPVHHRDRAVPDHRVVPELVAAPSTSGRCGWPMSSWPTPAIPRRCAGWSTRAGPRWPGHCAPGRRTRTEPRRAPAEPTRRRFPGLPGALAGARNPFEEVDRKRQQLVQRLLVLARDLDLEPG